jgi:hypothetical protein
VWDYDSWDVLSDRQVRLARDAGALFVLPIALNMRVAAHVFVGELTEAASMVAQAESVIEVTGSSLAPYGALALAVFRGREAQAARLIQAAIDDVGRRGEGRALSLMDWADAVLGNSLGRYAEALAAAQRASEDSLAVQFTGWALVELVEAAVRSAVPERAAGALQRLSGIARACPTDWALGAEARSRALVSDGAAAESLYRKAIDRFGRARLPVDLARARLVTASGCAASGAGVTPAISSVPRTRSSTPSAQRRLPDGPAPSCGRPAGTPGSTPSRRPMP